MEAKMDISYKVLWDAYMQAERQLDIDGRAACIAEMMKLVKKTDDMAEQKNIIAFLTYHFPITFLSAMEAVYKHQGNQAKYYLSLMEPQKYEPLSMLPAYQYWLGRAYYENGEYELAAHSFLERVKKCPQDEFAYFYLGNCFFHLNEIMQAAMEYQKAINVNNAFVEAKNNLNITLTRLNKIFMHNKDEFLDNLQDMDLSVVNNEDISFFDIPIFINNRDRVGTLQKLIDWLQSAGYKNIHVLDNKSTYPPLLAYYEYIKERNVCVWQLPINFGHRAIWDSNILNILKVNTPYVYTDSDVVPDEKCPHNILERLYSILVGHKYLKKVGLTLHIDDITYYNSAHIRKSELSLKHMRVKDGFFQSTDTTFALYRNVRHYCLREAFRTDEKLMARHLPWYYDYKNLPPDEEYYMKHANNSSTLSQQWKLDKGE